MENFQNKNFSRNIQSSKLVQNSEMQIREKMENPYWISTKNSDLFQIKKIFKDEKKIKKNYSITKLNKKINLDNHHTTQMATNYTYYKNSYTKNYLTTEFISTTLNEEENLYLKNKLETEGNLKSPTVLIDEITDRKEYKFQQDELSFKKASDQVEKKINLILSVVVTASVCAFLKKDENIDPNCGLATTTAVGFFKTGFFSCCRVIKVLLIFNLSFDRFDPKVLLEKVISSLTQI